MSCEEALLPAGVAHLQHMAQGQWTMVSGLAQVSARQPQLAALAEACGQSGAADHLRYFLTGPYVESPAPIPSLAGTRIGERIGRYLPRRRVKVPKLLSVTDAGRLRAGLLMHEYRAYGVPTGIYVPIDADGWRSVIAPAEERASVAIEAGEALLRRGAHVVLVSFSLPLSVAGSVEAFSQETGLSSPHLRATRVREVARVLPLADTYDGTLAPMGAHTRRNLRAMQRRVVREHAAEYLPAAEISLPAFLELNRACTYTVPDWVAEWRYESARNLPGGVFAGLRTGSGAWLSLIGGRRSRTTVHVDWQMNRQNAGSLSLVTAMRSFFLADEVDRGMRAMRFESGTPHSMHSAFEKELVCDVLLARRGITRTMLEGIGRVVPKDGVLAKVLASERLEWR